MSGSVYINGFNGIDTDTLIEAYMANDNLSLQRLEDKKDDTNEKLEVWREINTELKSFQEIAEELEDIFSKMNASTEDEEILTVTADENAKSGSYEIEVLDLAQAHKVASAQQTDSTSDLDLGDTDSGGTFTISLASGENFDVTVTGDDSLNDVMDKINNAAGNDDGDGNSLVTASIVDNTLVISSANTGVDNELSFTDGNSVLQELGIVDGSNVIQNELQGAQDAQIEVDGLTITRSFNEIDDVITGVTLNLEGLSDAGKTNTITIGPDKEVMKEKIEAFVNEYNALQEKINSYSEVTTDEDGDAEGSILTGDSTLSSIETLLYNSVVLPSNTVSSSDWVSTYPLAGAGKLVINGTEVTLDGSEDLQGIVDKINGAGITDIIAEVENNRIVIESDGVRPADLTGSSSQVLKDLKLSETFNNNTISLLGIEVDRYGELSIDEDKLDEALEENLSDFEQMFTGVNGVMERVEKSVDLAIDNSGYVDSEITSLENQIKYINEDIDDLERKMDMREERLRQKFIQMDQLISQLSSQGDWLSSMFSSDE